MSNKGIITLGGEDSFGLKLIGNQTWSFSIQPSNGQVFSDANIKFCIGSSELTLNDGIRTDGDGYLVDIKPIHLDGALQGKFVVFGDNSDAEMHIGYGKWNRETLK